MLSSEPAVRPRERHPAFEISTTLTVPLRLSLPLRLAVLAGVFLLEKALLSAVLDFDHAGDVQGLAAFIHHLQHWAFRFALTGAAALGVFAYVLEGQRQGTAASTVGSVPLRISWITAHLLLLAALLPLTYLLYHGQPSSQFFAVVSVLWGAGAAAAVLAALAAMAPLAAWVEAARSLGIVWLYASGAALIGAGAAKWTEGLWRPTAGLTFELVNGILHPFLPSLVADSRQLVLGTDRFAVQIFDTCSGLEGIGLMLAFCSAWLLVFRQDYLFPRALLLIPAGLLMVFALNAVRIAALLLIGHAGFPGAASHGFHSQAGWIAFNACACGLVYASHRSRWVTRPSLSLSVQSDSENPTAAYLMPLLALLFAGALSRALVSNFEWFYSLRLLAGLAALIACRKQLAAVDWRWGWRGLAAGLSVFVLWILTAHYLLPAAQSPAKLRALTDGARTLWIIGRVAASVLIVPVAEELAYRGFLMRRMYQKDFSSVPYSSVGWVGLIGSAILFGLLHGAMWLPATLAGVVYGALVIRTGRIGEAVVAHAATNLLIAAAVLGAGHWELW